MLQYPITSRPIYLLEKDSLNFKTSAKANLSNMLLKSLDKKDILTNKDEEFSSLVSDAIVIDLMSVIRRLSAVKIDNVTTFGSLCNLIITTIKSYGKKCEEIYLILENYKHFSIKSSERQRRAGVKLPGPLFNLVSDQQPLPDMKEFFTNATLIIRSVYRTFLLTTV